MYEYKSFFKCEYYNNCFHADSINCYKSRYVSHCNKRKKFKAEDFEF